MKTQHGRILEQLHSSGRLWLIAGLMLLTVFVNAQDPVFSQFNLNKNYLNPAYAGYSEDLQVGLNSRLQWAHIPGRFSTNTFNANIGCAPGRVGFGLMGYDHTEGEGYLRTQKMDLQVSTNLPGKLPSWMGKKLSRKKFIMSGGLGFGVGQKSIDWSKLTFSDQYGIYEGFLDKPSLVNGYPESSNVIFDMSAGLRMQAQVNRRGSYVSFGGAIYHMNRPVETFFNVQNQMEPRYTLHFFTYFQTKKFVNKPNYASIGMIMDKQQGLMTNTLIASKDVSSFGKVSLGFRRQNFLFVDQNVDALILQGMVSFGNFNIGYSYDITISSLGPHRTFGTHEVGITYTFRGLALCRSKGGGMNKKKSADDCFILMDDINPNFRDLFLWNP